MAGEGWPAGFAAAIRTTWREMHPDDPRQLCDSQTCLRFATVRALWPGTLAGQAYPVYCPECGAWAVRVAETLGARCDLQALPQPASSGRSIKVAGGIALPEEES